MQIGDTYNPYRLFHGAFIPNWLLQRTDVSPGSKLCFGRLAQYSGRNGSCYPRQDSLAVELGVGERQIRNYLTELSDLGLIRIVQKGLQQPNTYEFIWHDWIDKSAGQEWQSSAAHEGAPSSAPYLFKDIRESSEKNHSTVTGNTRTQKPSLEEAKSYAIELKLPPLEAEKFYDYYQSNGWKVGKNPMKDWKGAMRNWRRTWEERGTQNTSVGRAEQERLAKAAQEFPEELKCKFKVFGNGETPNTNRQ